MKAILAGVLACMFLFGGCALTDTGHGVEFIEDIQQEQFDALTQEVALFAEIGTRELFMRDQITKVDVEKVAALITSVATAPASDTVILAVGDSLSDYISNETLTSVLELIELEIRRWGGFTVIRAEDGTLYLSDRSKALLLAVANGLTEGVN